VIVSSFDSATLDRFHAVAPEVPTGVLVADLNAHPDAPERAAAAGHRALHPWEHFVDADLVRRCRALGLDINTWTVDDPVRIAGLAALGVAAVITNRPTVALDALGRGQRSGPQ
jgi:glycerophosphoryl diester phosphodiesterase